MLSDHEFVRYQRQIALDEIGEQGQQKLSQARVLIVGCGGLGNPAALYLGGAGVGNLVLADGDCVEVSNLHRQIGFSQQSLSQNKSVALAGQVLAANPQIRVRPVQAMLDGERLSLEVQQADLVLDCCDNFDTRYAVNQACVKAGKPLISAAVTGWDGQLILLRPGTAQPCYRCLFPAPPEQKRNCSTLGVAGPAVGVMGSSQALLALRYLLGDEGNAAGVLHLFKGQSFSWHQLRLTQSSDCPDCSSNAGKTSAPEKVAEENKENYA